MITEELPMLIKVTENIYKLVVRYPFGMHELNSYLIQGENGYTVIDTGSYAKESIHIWEQTIASGILVEKVVLTHAHPDHIGLARWFQERYHVPVFISDLGYKEIQKRQKQQGEKNTLNHFFKKHGGPEIPEEMLHSESAAFDFEPDGLFAKQQNIQLGNDIYETIWTPGHSPDHICFYHHQQKVMLIGDHVLAGVSPIIGIWAEDDAVNPLKDYFASLEMILTYQTELVLPGHGDLIVNLKNRVEEINSGHKYRLQQILQFVNDEGKTAGQVCQEIYGEISQKFYVAPLMATITRCIYLESIGKISSEMRNGNVVYQATT